MKSYQSLMASAASATPTKTLSKMVQLGVLAEGCDGGETGGDNGGSGGGDGGRAGEGGGETAGTAQIRDGIGACE